MATLTTPGNYDKSKTLLTTSLVVFAIVVVVLATAWWFIRKPHFDGKTPVSISVLLHEPRPVNATSPPVVLLRVTLTNQPICSNLLAVLQQGRLRRDHTCAPIGILDIKFANGKTNEVHLLPAHKSDDAEFRVGVLKYKVAREKLYSVFEAAGVDTSKIPAADH